MLLFDGILPQNTLANSILYKYTLKSMQHIIKYCIKFMKLSNLIFLSTNIFFYLEYVFEMAQVPQKVYIKFTFFVFIF